MVEDGMEAKRNLVLIFYVNGALPNFKPLERVSVYKHWVLVSRLFPNFNVWSLAVLLTGLGPA